MVVEVERLGGFICVSSRVYCSDLVEGKVNVLMLRHNAEAPLTFVCKSVHLIPNDERV